MQSFAFIIKIINLKNFFIKGVYFSLKCGKIQLSIGGELAIPLVCNGAYRSLLWKLIPVSSIPFPYIFLERTRFSGVDVVLLQNSRQAEVLPLFYVCLRVIKEKTKLAGFFS